MTGLHSIHHPVRPWREWVRNLVRVLVGVVVVVVLVGLMGMPLEAQGWAVVAYAVALGGTTGQSVVAAVNRIKGTIVGVLVGGASGYFLGDSPAAVRVSLAMAVTLLIAQFVPVGSGIKLGVALAGFFAFLPVSEEIATGGWRFGATILGIVVAIAVCLLLWPDTAARRLRLGIAASTAAAGDHAERAVQRWAAGTAATSVGSGLGSVPSVASLRALLADTHHELSREGPDARQFDGCLAGLAVVESAVPRLQRATVSPSPLATEVAPEVVALATDSRGLLIAIGSYCTAPSPGALAAARAAVGNPTQRVELAIEVMRTRHVTQARHAGEIASLFEVLSALQNLAAGAVSAATGLLQDSVAINNT